MNKEAMLKDMFRKGNDYYYDKSYDLAIDCYDQYLELCDDNTEQKGSILYNRGVVLIKQKQYDNALVDLQESIKILKMNKGTYKKIGNALFNIGYCYMKLRNSYMSYLYFSKATKYLPQDEQLNRTLDMIKKELTV